MFLEGRKEGREGGRGGGRKEGREGGRKEEREGGLRNIYRDCARHYASFSLTLVVSVKLILTTTHELSFCLYFYR